MRKRAPSDRARLPAANPLPQDQHGDGDDHEPMPAVGARRSTRVFVPKASKPQPSDPSDPARVLRSGKRLDSAAAADDDAHWLRWDASTKPKNDLHHLDDGHNQRDNGPEPPQPPSTKSFGIVYSRSRKRLRAQPKDPDSKFGIVFTRKKGKRSKAAPFCLHTPNELAAIPCTSSRDFASRAGFLDAPFWTLVDDVATHDGAGLLVFLVDTSCSGSARHFLRLLLPVLRWMRSSHRCKVWNLASFLASGDIATVFAMRGLHFVKLQRRRACSLVQRTLLHCGWCELRGARESRPLLSVNFSAIPSYFQSMHSTIALNSMYLPAIIRQSMRLVGGHEDMHPHEHLEVDSGSPSISNAEPAVDLGNNEPRSVVQDYVPLEQAAGLAVHGLRLKKHQRKRRSMRLPLHRQRTADRLHDKAIGIKQGAMATQTGLKPPLTRQEFPVEPVQPKPAFEISLDLLENMDDSDVSTPMGSNGKQRRPSLKSPVERVNEWLADVRQNIDSVHCKANLLVIQADRCRREEGAEVMLELSDSNEWCIAVKIHGVTRFSHKPSELRLYVVNRFTHAFIWGVEDGWKLEFSDKWDWLLFRELQIEGRERNSQGKAIPIPGVHEVDGMEGTVTDPFSLPVSGYIRMLDDEVARALSRDSIYDMDSEDEQWLFELNHADSDKQSSHLNHILHEEFEKIITTFEKDAYNSPGGTVDKDQLSSSFSSLEKGDYVLDVYEYWMNKRNKKKEAPLLLRVFQGAPLRHGQPSQKSSIKKRRSFKRQRSQAGRGKPEIFLQDNAEEEAWQRVEEAERAAKQAVETAVCLRSRAQSLMANAELATYKSVMALRIAEAARVSDSSRDLVTATLD